MMTRWLKYGFFMFSLSACQVFSGPMTPPQGLMMQGPAAVQTGSADHLTPANRRNNPFSGRIRASETSIRLESVSFNHDASSSDSDAINIRWNKTEDVVVPEWRSTGYYYLKSSLCSCGPGSPAAYIKGRSISIQAVFSSSPEVSSAEIWAARGFYGRLGDPVRQTVSFSGGTSGEVIFQVSGTTPEQILSFYQDWSWYGENVNGTGSEAEIFGTSLNPIYIVLAEPQLPWSASGQREAWVEVLRRSCTWAWGAATPRSAAEHIAKHL